MAELVMTFPGGKKVDAQIDGFQVRTDQPVQAGGEGSAPSPFLYCLVAMGTCAGIYVLSYLQARGLPTEGLKILQSHESDPRTGRIGKVRMEIQLPEGVGREHHPALVRSAEKCAVKKLIEQPPEFEITASASA